MSDNPIIDGMVTGALVGSIGTINNLKDVAAGEMERAAEARREAADEKRKARRAQRESADANRQLEIATLQIEALEKDVSDLQEQLSKNRQAKDFKNLAGLYSDQVNELREEIHKITSEHGVKDIYEENQRLKYEIEQNDKKNTEQISALKNEYNQQLYKKDDEIADLKKQMKEWMASKQLLQKIARTRRERLGMTDDESLSETINAAQELAVEEPNLANTEVIANTLKKAKS